MKKGLFILSFFVFTMSSLFAQQSGCHVGINIFQTTIGFVKLKANANGAGPFTFAWSTGATTDTISVNVSGEYCVTITSPSGCTDSKCVQVNVPPPPPACEAHVHGHSVPNGTFRLEAEASGAAPFTYLWSNGATTDTITVDASGEYCVTITSSTGCTASDCEQVNIVPPPPACEVHVHGHPAMDGTFHLDANASGAAPFTYLWSNGATTENIDVDASGEYCVTITSSTGCTASDCFQVNILPPPTTCEVHIHGHHTVNGVRLLRADAHGAAPFTYLWSNGATTDTTSVTDDGEYCVTITSSTGCTASDCELVEAPPAAPDCIVFIHGHPDFDGGLHLRAFTHGAAPFTYLWSNGATTDTISVDATGEYCVTVTSSTGCTASNCVQINNIPPPPPACHAEIITHHLSVGVVKMKVFAQGAGPFTYLWNTGATTDTITVSELGTYCVTITSSTGCTAEACRTINHLSPEVGEPAGISVQNNTKTASNLSAITIYPNPGHDVVQMHYTASADGTVRIQILSLTGQVMKSVEQTVVAGTQEIALPVSELAGGVYLVQVSDGVTSNTLKMIIE